MESIQIRPKLLTASTVDQNPLHVEPPKTQKPPPMAISLRKFTLADADEVLVWASDERVTRYVHWNGAKTSEELHKFLEETVNRHPWFRAISLDGRAVGGISMELHSKEEDRCRAKVGYLLAVQEWGKGIMTAAVRMAVEEVFGHVAGLERIEAMVDSENLASMRVLEKVGFVREGVLRKYTVLRGSVRDNVVYSLLKSEFVSMRG